MQRELDYPLLFACLFDRKLIRGGVIPVLDVNMVEAIGKREIRRAYFTGNVELINRIGNREFQSLVPRSNQQVVRVRGGPNVAVEFCRYCKQHPVCSHGHPYRPYVLKSDLSESCRIFPGERATLLVRKEFLERLIPFKKGLQITRIPIVESPRDDLPVDLNTLPKDFRRRIQKP